MLALFSLEHDLIVANGVVADELQAAVVMTSPEEGNSAVGYILAEHVKCSVGALLQSHNPMLDAGARPSGPVGDGSDVTSGEHIRQVGLHEWITDETTVAVHLDARALKEGRVWAHTGAHDHDISGQLGAVVKCHTLDLLGVVFGRVCRFHEDFVEDGDTVSLVLLLIPGAKLLTKGELEGGLVTVDHRDSRGIFVMHLESSGALRADERCTNNDDILRTYTGLLDVSLVLVASQREDTLKVEALDGGHPHLGASSDQKLVIEDFLAIIADNLLLRRLQAENSLLQLVVDISFFKELSRAEGHLARVTDSKSLRQ
mmetsp:Transcript_12891/g.16557  ORF Transcript_12891/g.16557 Transcript_12891/m.16557 type:complete len:315 (+) Transcript_12891:353-1297(+)